MKMLPYLSRLLPLLLCGSFFPKSSDARPKDLLISEINEITISDLDKETESSTAEILFEKLSDFEWSRALQVENKTNRKRNFLLCHKGQNLSGHQRKKKLKLLFSSTEEDLDITANVYNGDKFYCAFAYVLPSIVDKVDDEDAIAQLWHMSVKFPPRTFEQLEEIKTFDQMPTIDVGLCPGSADNVDVDLIFDKIKAQINATGNGFGPVPTADDDERTFPWMSDTINNLNDITLSERAKKWKEIFEKVLVTNVDVCEENYGKHLKANVVNGISGKVEKIELTFINDDGTKNEFDPVCILALLGAAANEQGVCDVSIHIDEKTSNVNAQWIGQSTVLGYLPFFDSGLTGKDQIVAVSDTGIDGDHCSFWDADTPIPFSNNLIPVRNNNHRKIVEYITFSDSRDNNGGHGTHVAGTAIGHQATSGTTESTGGGDGTARGAKVAFIDIQDSRDNSGNLDVPSDTTYLLNTGRRDNPVAQIHSASWGSEIPSWRSDYTRRTAEFDDYTFFNDNFLAIVAAGNSGNGNRMETIGAPASGKNVLCIGASENYGSSGNGGKGIDYLADFSSRGPTRDGRMKPDIVAPGAGMNSANANVGQIGNCGLLKLQGTSMATPAVSGLAAIARQYFEQGYYPSGLRNVAGELIPSGALLKAVMMNGAFPLVGVNNGKSSISSDLYDNNQGFGRVSLINSLYLPQKTNVDIKVFDRENVNDLETNTYNVTFDELGTCANRRLSVTLVWMDPPVQVSCKICLVNDLDLLVTRVRDGARFYPNRRSGPERNNNAERVQIENVGTREEFKISVTARNIADPNATYALVYTGCFDREVAKFDPNAAVMISRHYFVAFTSFVGAAFLLL